MSLVAERGNRETIELFYKALNSRDYDAYAQCLGAGYAQELPQSGERSKGSKNALAVAENYPGGLPELETRRITGSEDRWVTTPSWTILKITGSGDDYTVESLAKYPDGKTWHAIDIFGFRDEKIVHHTSYYAEPFDAPAWRSQWVERI